MSLKEFCGQFQNVKDLVRNFTAVRALAACRDMQHCTDTRACVVYMCVSSSARLSHSARIAQAQDSAKLRAASDTVKDASARGGPVDVLKKADAALDTGAVVQGQIKNNAVTAALEATLAAVQPPSCQAPRGMPHAFEAGVQCALSAFRAAGNAVKHARAAGASANAVRARASSAAQTAFNAAAAAAREAEDRALQEHAKQAISLRQELEEGIARRAKMSDRSAVRLLVHLMQSPELMERVPLSTQVLRRGVSLRVRRAFAGGPHRLALCLASVGYDRGMLKEGVLRAGLWDTVIANTFIQLGDHGGGRSTTRDRDGPAWWGVQVSVKAVKEKLAELAHSLLVSEVTAHALVATVQKNDGWGDELQSSAWCPVLEKWVELFADSYKTAICDEAAARPVDDKDYLICG
jgi:hypothetical protein